MRYSPRDKARDSERESYHVLEIPGATGMPKTQVWQLLGSGELASFKIGRRRYVRAETLRAFIKRRETAARPRARTEDTAST